MALLLLPAALLTTAALLDEEEEERRQREELARVLHRAAQAKAARAQLRAQLPINVATVVIPAFPRHLGITLASVSDGRGVRVKATNPRDLAAQHGLSAGDWITSINGFDVETHSEAIEIMKREHSRGNQLFVSFASERAVSVNVNVEGKKAIGISVCTEPNRRGVLVTRLEPDSVLAKNGLRVGDVITYINSKRVVDFADAARLLKKARQKRLFSSPDAPRLLTLVYMTALPPIAGPVTSSTPTPLPANRASLEQSSAYTTSGLEEPSLVYAAKVVPTSVPTYAEATIQGY